MQTNWTTHWTMDTRIASTKMKLQFQTCFYVTDVGKLATVNLEFILSLEGVSLQHTRNEKNLYTIRKIHRIHYRLKEKHPKKKNCLGVCSHIISNTTDTPLHQDFSDFHASHGSRSSTLEVDRGPWYTLRLRPLRKIPRKLMLFSTWKCRISKRKKHGKMYIPYIFISMENSCVVQK